MIIYITLVLPTLVLVDHIHCMFSITGELFLLILIVIALLPRSVKTYNIVNDLTDIRNIVL